MRNAQKPDHISLNNMVSRLRDGQYVIPDFQRDFEWQPWDINSLMSSIFRDYYIGSLLLWRGKDENYDSLACEPLYGYKGRTNRPDIVLDGQQRLTAMHYAFMAPDVAAPKRHNRFLYFIRVDHFMDGNYEEAFHYDWTRRGLNLIADCALQFESHLFPLSVVGAGGWKLGNWVQGYQQYWTNAAEHTRGTQNEEAKRHVENAQAFGRHLRDITEQYQISYIELDEDLELEKVCDIFTQINSRGVRLTAFDLINALLRPKGLQLRLNLWRAAEARLDFVETQRMNVYVLQVMSILKQAYCSPRYLYYLLPDNARPIRGKDGVVRPTVLVDSADEFERLWNTAVDSIERAIDLLRHPREFGAISSQYLPYVSILPAFASIQTRAAELPADKRLAAQRKIRLWYWASVFTNRYAGSVESTAARDFQDVVRWFDNDNAEPTAISEFRSSVRDLDLRRETRKGSAVYNGVFNLLILKGARDWVTGNVPKHGDLDDHHIVPKSWNRRPGLRSPIDTILNRTPLSGETNREIIGDSLPHEYLPELVSTNGEEHVLAILESHFISRHAFEILTRNPFTPADFEEFLTERRRALLEGIEDLLVKQRLDLAPHVRELDGRIESVELELRRRIGQALRNDSRRLPSHILQRLQARVATAIRRNPELDQTYYGTLSGQLTYADLRDLEDAIKNRTIWPMFEEMFGTKEMVGNRFQQFANLRNSIRHSRAVDNITRMEGEAATIWFEQNLAHGSATD